MGYRSGILTTKLGGKETKIRAMAFGKANDSVAGIWADGQVRLYGVLESGSNGGRVFRVIAPGLEPKGTANSEAEVEA